ncbi:MAG: SdrD B-like domain-containing protein, partial [Acidimicrobiales bacterium]
TVELLDGTGTVIATTTTDGAGAYAFTGVAAGDHTVRIVSATLPSNVTTPSADRDATLDGQTTVTVPAGGVIDDADFGYEPDPTTGSIVVEVFADIDGNATQDGADPDLSGVTVELLDNSGTVVATGVTAADGTFTFSGVLAGDYTTRVDTSTLPADTTTLTADPDATADSSHPLTLVAGTTDTSSVYGYQPLGS